MRLMTPATVKNLPSYLADARQRRLLDREDQDRQNAEEEKKAFMEFSVELMKLGQEATDPKDMNGKLSSLASKYRGVLPPQAMQHAAQYVEKWASNFYQNQARDEKKLLDTENKASKQGLVNAIRGVDSVGGNEYQVPMTEEDHFGSMTEDDQMRLLDYQEKQKAAKAKEEDRLLQNSLTNEQLSNAKRRGRLLDTQSHEDAANKKLENEVQEYFGRLAQMGGRGDTRALKSRLSPKALQIVNAQEQKMWQGGQDRAFTDQKNILDLKNKQSIIDARQGSDRPTTAGMLKYVTDNMKGYELANPEEQQKIREMLKRQYYEAYGQQVQPAQSGAQPEKKKKKKKSLKSFVKKIFPGTDAEATQSQAEPMPEPITSIDELKSLTHSTVKDAYGQEKTLGPVNSLATRVQKTASKLSGGMKYGEGEIGKALRLKGVTSDLAEQKAIIYQLEKRFPNATEKDLVNMIMAIDGTQIARR